MSKAQARLVWVWAPNDEGLPHRNRQVERQMTAKRTILVTGGAGFIGSALVRELVKDSGTRVVNIDALTYAGNLTSLAEVANASNHVFEHADIRDRAAIGEIFAKHEPDAVLHLAAESHVDRSIDDPSTFISTNVNGTHNLLAVARAHYERLGGTRRQAFRFVHVSTDEVFGSLGPTGAFDETTPYDPRSPYSASKAASDHLARAWFHTYGLPVIVTNCSNNYGSYQFPEKLIPLMILRGMRGEEMPVYGSGANVRDWLHVADHVRGLLAVLEQGRPGEVYAFGGRSERTNLEVVEAICEVLDEERPGTSHAELIRFVTDRPGHDQRYAIDPAKAEYELDWRPRVSFEEGLRDTVRWYLKNESWWAAILDGSYRLERLGAVSAGAGTLEEQAGAVQV